MTPDWLGRPTGRGPTLILGLVILLAPGWLMAERFGNLARPLGTYALIGDDFAYLAESRTNRALLDHLWTPHNAHVVPLFRVGTHLLCRAAGRLATLPEALGAASYGALVLAMLAVGRFVAREAQDRALGLAASAILGISSILEPSTTWYSAGQTLWASVLILGMLLALQGWRAGGGPWPLGLAFAAALAAPACWSGGYVAGPAGAIYLWTGGRSRERKAAVLPLLGTGLAGAIALAMAGPQFLKAADPAAGRAGPATRLVRGLLHTGQAIPEVLVGQNLGLDVPTTPVQGAVLSLGLAAAWVATRRSWPNPMEATGATLILTGFGLAFAFRGYLGYDSLRPLQWYNTIPDVGAVLAASGWWSGLAMAPAKGFRRLSRRGLIICTGLVAVLLGLHAPRVERRLIAEGPPLTTAEREPRNLFPIPVLQRLRAVYFLMEDAGRQRRALARLDRAEAIGRQLGIGRAAIRRTFGRVVVPGWPSLIAEEDAIDLLDLPEVGPFDDPRRTRASLGPLFAHEPAHRPEWLRPTDPWPPPGRGD